MVPELGPSLGKLVAPPPPPAGTPSSWIALDDIRLTLVTQLFELAGDARRWAAEGDRELALATLNRQAWETVWQRAVDAVAARAATAISERMLAAAREARIAKRRARALPLDAAEVRDLARRLVAGNSTLAPALAALDRAAHPVRTEHASPGAVMEWQESLLAVARRMESAWLSLEEALGREWRDWGVEIEELRTWRRPLWPLVAIAAGVLGLAGYFGLVLGGYLPVPNVLRTVVEAVWARWN